MEITPQVKIAYYVNEMIIAPNSWRMNCKLIYTETYNLPELSRENTRYELDHLMWLNAHPMENYEEHLYMIRESMLNVMLASSGLHEMLEDYEN